MVPGGKAREGRSQREMRLMLLSRLETLWGGRGEESRGGKRAVTRWPSSPVMLALMSGKLWNCGTARRKRGRDRMRKEAAEGIEGELKGEGVRKVRGVVL
jgi:hypothetical protein